MNYKTACALLNAVLSVLVVSTAAANDVPEWLFRHANLVRRNAEGDLVSLGIDSSSFTDVQMRKVCSFETLEYLYLHSPSVTADAMKSLKRLTKLREVIFAGDTAVDSTVVKELRTLPTLNSLTFMKMELDVKMLAELATISKLRSLEFQDCLIARNGTTELGRCVQLNVVVFQNCEIQGADWSFLSRLKKLHRLRIAFMSVSAATLSTLGKNKSLRSLELRLCSLDKSAVSAIGSLDSLESLFLDGGVNGSNIREVFRLTKLRELTLYPDGETVGTRLAGIEVLKDLRALCIGGIDLKAEEVRHVAQLERLTRLELPSCSIGDAGVAQLVQLKHLRILDVRDTRVTSDSFASFRAMKGLEELVLEDCNIDKADIMELKNVLPNVDVQF